MAAVVAPRIGPSDWTVDVVPSLAELPGTELTRLAAESSFYATPQWLRSVERARGGGVVYLCCRSTGGELVGVLPVYQDVSTVNAAYDVHAGLLAPSGGAFHRDDWVPGWAVGTSAAHTCEFLLDRHLAAPRSGAVLSLLLERAGAWCARQGAASVSAAYLNERGRRQLLAAGIRDDALCLAAAACVVECNWSTMEDYVASLGRRAVNARREMRVFGEAGYTLTEGRLSEFLPEAAELFTNLQQKYGEPPGRVAQRLGYLRTLADCCDATSTVLAARRGERTVAAVLLFAWHETIYVRSAGFDYAASGKAFEYLNLAIYEPIRMAIERGYRSVDLGRATHQAKVARGARLRPRFNLAWSFRAGSPMGDPVFAEWDAARRAAVHSGDLDAMRRYGVR